MGTLPTPAPASLADASHHFSVATALLAQWHDKVDDPAGGRNTWPPGTRR